MSEQERYDLQGCIDDAKGAFKEALEGWGADKELSGVIHEIADGCVPIYHTDILDVAASDYDVSLRTPECGPAFDGTSTPVNIAAANIYELIEEALYEYARELEQEAEDNAIAN